MPMNVLSNAIQSYPAHGDYENAVGTPRAQSSAEQVRTALVEANTLAARAMSIVTMICGNPKNYQGCELKKEAVPAQSGVLPEIIDQATATRRTIKEAHDRLSDLEREFS